MWHGAPPKACASGWATHETTAALIVKNPWCGARPAWPCTTPVPAPGARPVRPLRGAPGGGRDRRGLRPHGQHVRPPAGRLRPDFICLSKGLTGGTLALSAVLTTETVYAAFRRFRGAWLPALALVPPGAPWPAARPWHAGAVRADRCHQRQPRAGAKAGRRLRPLNQHARVRHAQPGNDLGLGCADLAARLPAPLQRSRTGRGLLRPISNTLYAGPLLLDEEAVQHPGRQRAGPPLKTPWPRRTIRERPPHHWLLCHRHRHGRGQDPGLLRGAAYGPPPCPRGGMKAVAAGARPHGHGGWANGHAGATRRVHLAGPPELDNPVLLPDPLSPHIAAQRRGPLHRDRTHRGHTGPLAQQADAVVVEGAGGFLVPLSDQLSGADLACALDLPVVMVVGLRLGCLNHAALTAEAIRARGLRLAGWIASRVDPAMLVPEENMAWLRQHLDRQLQAPLLADIPFQQHPDPRATTYTLPEQWQ
ncbi:Hyaluronan and proteoglycan link protein 2 [Manis javanica]|nr:Hyaluronan and proteoglycan link protein 2 [Manis javanica]